MGILEDRRRKNEERKQYREHETSLIHAMYDSGYRVNEIAFQLNIPVRTVYHRLGFGSTTRLK